MAQQVTSGSTTTTTVYVAGVEEVATTGATTTTTAYYYAGARRIALSLNGTLSYLAADGLGSANVTLSASGSATASVLYAPYGGMRYSSGTMPTTYGFTGQRPDAVSGLDYYGSRYYDPLAGQFTSADSVVPGDGFELLALSRYGYVGGNPENRTDPTGHVNVSVGDDGSAVPIENAFQGTYSWGSGPALPHRGTTRPYPTSRSRSQRIEPSASTPVSTTPPDQSANDRAEAILQANVSRINTMRTADLLTADRDDWSSLDRDTTAALAWLAGNGNPDQWCQSNSCQRGMRAAQEYVHDLRTALALGLTLSMIGSSGGATSDLYLTLPNGTRVYIPNGYSAVPSESGNGIDFRPPTQAVRNAGSIRVMPPGADAKYPTGYFRYYNQAGQPLDVVGKPGPPAETHSPL